MSSIKKLAGQTMWYGVSSIAARFLNYLLTPYLTGVLTVEDYGKMGLVYSALPILNVIFTYGLETAYFRYASKEENKRSIYNTTATSIIISTILFGCALLFFHGQLAQIAGVGKYPELIQLSIFIIMLDTLTIIPFARLRQEGRPRKYALIKIGGIVVNIFFTFFFLSWCRNQVAGNPSSVWSYFYNPARNPVYYVVMANLIQAGVTFLFLYKELGQIRLSINGRLWREIMLYSLPLVLVGMGGVVNEVFDRLMLHKWVPGSDMYKEQQVGIYNACYKLSILITLFVQAFRMGAEPFFFKQAGAENPQRTYARVMKFFVIVICIMFLVVSLYLPVWRYFISSKEWEGLKVVPILLLANMFLGIYYNLSIWYKLSHKTIAGAYITLIGAAITITINYIFIPTYGYMACAWATFFCYGSMMLISFVWGQKSYRVPYAWKKLCAYIVIVVLLYFAHNAVTMLTQNRIIDFGSATILLFFFLWFVARVEHRELVKLPVVGKFFRS